LPTLTQENYRFFTAFGAPSAKSFKLELSMPPDMSLPLATVDPSRLRAPRSVSPPGLGDTRQEARLREVALKLEAAFLSEMLKSAGLGAVPGSFGGGQGEEQFASFLRDAQATEMARAGGIGLAESLFEAMKSRQNG
jgi:peptidoglycan hydrolase FlgJ